MTIEHLPVPTEQRLRVFLEATAATTGEAVTGEDHFAEVHLPQGFIWTRGECGQGTYSATAAGVSVASENTNWILYGFDWSNA